MKTDQGAQHVALERKLGLTEEIIGNLAREERNQPGEHRDFEVVLAISSLTTCRLLRLTMNREARLPNRWRAIRKAKDAPITRYPHDQQGSLDDAEHGA
jgi:hypothetical protein